jgi:DNA repair exonuclease SbcCD ATPase subunit
MSHGGDHRAKIEELRRQLSAKDALLAEREETLAARTAELAAAKTGLIAKTLEAEKLKAQLARLRREKFGASSERIERAIEQFELALEEVEAATAEITVEVNQTEAPDTPPVPDGPSATDKKKRRQLPPELPRHDIVHAPAGVCKACGGTELRQVGESVTEVLEYIPGRFEVTRHVRPAVSCRKCEAMMQVPMPDLPIPRGMAGASLLAHVATSKFCDHRVPRTH